MKTMGSYRLWPICDEALKQGPESDLSWSRRCLVCDNVVWGIIRDRSVSLLTDRRRWLQGAFHMQLIIISLNERAFILIRTLCEPNQAFLCMVVHKQFSKTNNIFGGKKSIEKKRAINYSKRIWQIIIPSWKFCSTIIVIWEGLRRRTELSLM
jgi:hypothetical protein